MTGGTTARRLRARAARWVPRSLRVRLLLSLCAAIAVVAAVQGVLSYRSALAEADDLFDYHMQQTALALRAGLPVDARGLGRAGAPEDEHRDFIVQVWTLEGLRIFESALGAELPQLAVLGFTNVQARGSTYRVFSLQTRAQVIQVAQDMAVRRGMARKLAWGAVAPTVLLAPLLALAVWWAVGGSLAPVERVRRQLAERRADALSPVQGDDLPEEVRPLVDELNLLFARVQQAFEAQQHFVADAAHELRSPLAALKLQVQGLQRAPDDGTRAVALGRLAAGIDRATRLVEQLLALARQEAQATAGAPPGPVDLAALARQAVLDAAPAAHAQGVDLGLGRADGVPALGHADALRILLRNLVDNAVKYTPAGGTVDVGVSAEGDGVLLWVDDSGPGIAPAERERVLGRFHRALQVAPDGTAIAGSGLGLAIVQAIARQHGTALVLQDAPGLGGLRAALCLPAAPPH